ncbi:MAG: hypothetical protein IPG24_22380 [Leptospiraceae bacterium]|nr:hypothetical protein [Leptospiraceae bacterium]
MFVVLEQPFDRECSCEGKCKPTLGVVTLSFGLFTTNLSFENIFFVNGYGRVGTTSRMHDGESGQNNMKELDAIIERCIKVAAIDLKEFVK